MPTPDWQGGCFRPGLADLMPGPHWQDGRRHPDTPLDQRDPRTPVMSDKARLSYVGVDDASEAPEPLPRRRPGGGPPGGSPLWPAGPGGGLPPQLPPSDVTPQPGPPAGTANGQLPRRPAADSLQEPAAGQLPRRPPRVLPVGRHRSPHRLTLPADAPPLVLAVGGAACPASDDITAEIVSAVQGSCPGAIIRVGYLEGSVRSLTEMLTLPGQDGMPQTQPAIVVPLLAGPHPRFDAALASAVAAATTPVIVTGPLGPHPLIAEALHARLADAGLARASRVRGLSISNAANGVVVLADRGLEAAQAAAVVAVLLSSRLAIPAAPASLGDQESIDAAIARLHAAGASRLAIGPCVIGPENDPGELAAVCAATGAQRAETLSAHPAISQLVAMRYGAALADRRLAG
jgi:sirohydrochlorin ferrochelatase